MNGGVLITGGTSFLAGAVLRHLQLAVRRPLIAAVRSPDADLPPGVRVERVAGLETDADWSGCVQGVLIRSSTAPLVRMS